MKTAVHCAIWIFLSCFAFQSQAQLTILCKDSVEAGENTVWLNNDIILENNSGKILDVQIALTLPSHWEAIAQPSREARIEPGTRFIIPLNLLRNQLALSKWQSAIVTVTNKNTGEVTSKTFYLKSFPVSKFTLQARETKVLIDADTKVVELEVQIANTGNVDEHLTISAFNNFFGISSETRKKLEGGEVYNYTLKVKISDYMRKSFVKENIRISAKNENFKNNSIIFEIGNLSQNARQHVSSHPVFPVEFETGIMHFADQYTYYAATRGSVPMKKNRFLNYSYRTKQLGIANTIERNAFSLEYISRRWKLYAGELSDLGSFFGFGQGFSVTRQGQRQSEVKVSAIFHYQNHIYSNNIYSATVKHNLKKIRFSHELAVNSQPKDEQFGFVFNNEVQLVNKDDLQFSVKLSAGENHYMMDKPGVPEEKTGTALGYDFVYNWKSLRLNSSLFNASEFFPGVFSGNKNQNHSLGVELGTILLNGFYQYNRTKTKNILFLDTVYNTTFFDFDFERYGLQFNWTGKALSNSLSFGKYRQTGTFNYLLPSAKFIDLSTNYRKGRYFSIRFNSTNGFSKQPAKSDDIWITRTNMALNTKNLGLRSFYIRTPRVQSIGRPDTSAQVIETYSVSPYVRFTLFKHLNLDLNYTFTRSLYDNSLATFAGTNFMYSNRRIGFETRFTGNIPISKTSSNFSNLANNSMVLYLKKTINFPNVFKKLYSDLRVTVFIDTNQNGKMDPGELPMPGMVLDISGRSFKTGQKGTVTYRNIENKYYIISTRDARAPRGYIPAGGDIQFVNVEKNTEFFLPYNKGMVITGKISVILDKFGSTLFTPAGIKVVVSDTLGNYWKVLADEKGEWYVSVPPGEYKVSLNPDAFSSDIKPVVMFYMVTVGKEREEAIVNFEIKENARKINFLKKE